jgi:spermidine/putrescine transport system ATP-binding protein
MENRRTGCNFRLQYMKVLTPMESILKIENVSKRFQAHQAVDDVSIAIPRGSFYGLVGPSGCGKTTTLRLIAGFEDPDTGSISLEGARLEGLKPYERNVSTVFQSYALFPHLTVQGNVEFGLRRKGAPGVEKRAREAIELVQLGGKESRYPAQLSGGEKQRVALARSLVTEPAVLLLDEPLSALDPNLRAQVRVELKSLQRRVGTTFLFITHDREEALSMSDSLAVMNRGRIEQAGVPEDLYLRPRTKFVASFLGAVNWLEGVGVRPEAVKVSPAPSGMRTCRVSISHTVFLGDCVQITARTPAGADVVARVSRFESVPQAGVETAIWWRPEDELRCAE